MEFVAGLVAKASRRLRVGLLAALATAAALIAASAAFGAAGHFTAAPGSPITVGEEPQNLVSGDFDGDGLADLAVANSSDHSVSILLGTGEGRFAPAEHSPEDISNRAAGIDASDLDGDGNLDLAIASWGAGPSDVTILLGDGSGDFSAAGPPIDPGFSAAIDLVAADFDGDENPDLAVADLAGDDVKILLGAGDGTFAEASGSPVAVGASPQAIAIGNLNGDADLDLAIPNRVDGTVTLLLGDGSGGFTEAENSPLAVPEYPRAIAVGQLDGSPGDDIAIASDAAGNVSVLLNDGSGGFTSASGSPFAVSGASYVEPADLDGDGALDLAVSGGGSAIFALRNDGHGSFTRFSDEGEGVGNSPLGIVAGDFDQAGLPDLAVANFNSDDVAVLLNDSGPSVAIHGPPRNGQVDGDPSPVFELSSDTPGATFIYRVDNGPWKATADDWVVLGPLSDGEHRFRARAVDAIGNQSLRIAERRFIIDTRLIKAKARIRKRQPQHGAKIRVTARARAGERGIAVLRARVRIGHRFVALKPGRAKLKPGSPAKLRATASGRAARRIKAWMASGHRPRARVKLEMWDRAGNTIRIKRMPRLVP